MNPTVAALLILALGALPALSHDGAHKPAPRAARVILPPGRQRRRDGAAKVRAAWAARGGRRRAAA